ncbi:MAG: GrpB family protein, partial [Bacteroidota bacterium]
GTDAFPIIKNGLETLGYFHNGNQGIVDREVFKRNRTLSPHPVLDSIQHHLYVCPDFSEELKKHLLFRNYLRGHAEARKHYETIKIQLSKEANQDRKVYAMLKEEKASDFIASTLSKAQKEPFT